MHSGDVLGACEMSDVRTNAASGHCYLEFIEKNAITGQLVAKARGSIWAKTFRMLKPYFEMETGQNICLRVESIGESVDRVSRTLRV